MIPDRGLFTIATNIDVDCVSHQAVRLDYVILLSNSIGRARARPRCGYVRSVVILSVVRHHRHGRISVIAIDRRASILTRALPG